MNNTDLKTIYSQLAAGKITKAAAMERIRALKGATNNKTNKDKTTRLVTPSWHNQPLSEGDTQFVQVLSIDGQTLDFGGADLAEQYQNAALDLLTRVQKLLAQKSNGKVLLQLAINSERQVLQGLQGLLRSAALENPNLVWQVISGESHPEQLALEAKSGQSALIRYHQGQRQVMGWQDVQSTEETAGVSFKDSGTYLITGGLGGIGIQFAKAILSQTTKAKVVLTGRAESLSPDKKALLESLAGQARVAYQQMDLTDAASVKSVIDSTEGLSGILHSAGMNQDSFVVQKTAEQLKAVFAPKVQGTIHLVAACKDLSLDFIALFSSVSSWLGNVGQADYACANGFMEAIAEQSEQHIVSINWPLWREGGMEIEQNSLNALEARTGLSAIESDTGVGAFHHSLLGGARRTMLLEGDARVLHNITDIPQALRTANKPVKPAVKASGDLTEQTLDWLREQFSALLKMPAERIDAKAQMENYGIDSILAMNLTNTLEKTFGPLSKTLFFEYLTIAELADFLVSSHAETLTKLFTKESVPVSEQKPQQSTAAKPVRTTIRESRQRAPITANRAEPIAIVGLSGRYPESTNLDAYWQNLAGGKDCITEVPESRWDWQHWYSEDRTEQDKHYSKWGGFIAGVDEFDPRFFAISPKEATTIDPQERLFLQHVWLAVEDAGLTRERLQIARENDQNGQVGVYAGVMYGEYHRSGSLASVANRVSYVLNVHGPSMTVDTMCSSSLTAIHLACQDLKSGRTDVGIAGGVNVSVHPGKYLMLSSGQFISSDGHCQSFGVGGDGYIPGEGVGVMVMRRLRDAEREGHHIYGVIKGSALNHGGKTNGYTVPNPQAQASAISQALLEGQVDPRHISYIEAHGTGTKLGDPIEIAALTKAFYHNVADGNKATGFCLVGSAKSNVGHCESAAGIAGVTKVLLQLKNKQIVPSLHSKELNPHIDFAATPFIVNQQLADWAQPEVDGKLVPRIAGISSFGAGGSNAHVLVEEYVAQSKADVKGPVAIVLSARNSGQLQQKAADLLAFVEKQSDISLASMAYTLQVGREALDERAAFIAESLSDVKAQLSDFAKVKQTSVKRLQSVPSAPEINQNNLQALVDAWLGGAHVEWAKLYRNNPGLISLPGYPFAKEKYWHMPELPQTASTQVVDATLYPLLHRNVSDLQGLRFESQFSGNEVFVKDGALPDILLLEMAKTACEKVYRNSQQQLVLREVNWGAQAQANHTIEVHVLDGGVEISNGDDICLQAKFEWVSQQATRINTAQLSKLSSQQWLFEALSQLTDQYHVLSLEQVSVIAECTDELFYDIQQYQDTLEIRLCDTQGQVLLHAQGLRFETVTVQQTVPVEIAEPQIVEPQIAETAKLQSQPVEEKPAPVISKIELPLVTVASESVPVVNEPGPLTKPDNIKLIQPEAFVTSDKAILAKPKLALLDVDATVATSSEAVKANLEVTDHGTGLISIQKSDSDPDYHNKPGSESDFRLTITSLKTALGKIATLETAKVILLDGVTIGDVVGSGREVANYAIESGLCNALINAQVPVIAKLPNGALGVDILIAACADFIAIDNEAPLGFGGFAPSVQEIALLNERFGRDNLNALFINQTPDAGQLRAKGWMLSEIDDVDTLVTGLCEKSVVALGELKPHLSRFLTGLVDDLVAVEAAKAVSEKAAVKIKAPSKRLSVEVLAGKTLKVTLEPVKAEHCLATLYQDFLQVFMSLPTGIESVLLTSNLDGFAATPKAMPEHDDIENWVQLFVGIDVPVVAAVESDAVDFGFFLSLCCDYAIFNQQGKIGFSSDVMISSLGPWVCQLLPQRLGQIAASRIGFAAEHLQASELLEVAPSLNIVAKESVVESAMQLAGNIKQKASVELELPKWPEIVQGDAVQETSPITLKTDVVAVNLQDNGIVEISLQERDAKNMFTEQLALGLREAFDAVANDSGCKVVVLTGYDSYFASGGTLDTLLAIQDGTAQFTDEKTFQLPMDCPLPVIAAMQGHGLGGGWSFGMFADYYLLSEESHFVSPYMNYGFTPGAGSTLVFPKRLGYDFARLSLLTGVQLTGQQLKDKGLRLPVLPRKSVVTEAHKLAERFAQLPRKVLIALKSAWTASLKAELVDTYSRELAMHDKTFVGSMDTLEQINSKFIREQASTHGEETRTTEVAPMSEVESNSRRDFNLAKPGIAAENPVDGGDTLSIKVDPVAADIMPKLQELLAAELHLEPVEVEQDEQFVDLGLDSITGVTFIRKVNAEYGTDIEATKVYSYPTLRELTDYVVSLAPGASSATEVAPMSQVEENSRRDFNLAQPVVDQNSIEGHDTRSIEVASVGAVDIMPKLQELLAAELHLEFVEVEQDEQFVDLGLDSITGVTFVRKVNAEYGTDIEATKVYSYPTLRELTDYVVSLAPRASSATKVAPTMKSENVGVEENGRRDFNLAQPGMVEQNLTDGGNTKPVTQKSERPSLTSWISTTKPVAKQAQTSTVEPIAVIGMAGQFPMANDVDSFWENIAEGKNCISEIDAERWSATAHFQTGSPTPGKANSKWLGALEQYDQFDPLFFNISPGEADAMDPQQRLFLQACYHGFEHAGYNPQSLSGSRCGVFVGCSTGDYHQVNRDIQLSAQGFTGSASSILAARISYFLNLQGPCIAIETACSSSLVAIANACDSLNAGGSDIALAGGSCVMSGPDMHIMTSQAGMLSTDGRCFTFDQRANGFVPGEAVGVVVLKRLSQAEQDQDIIHSVIRGWGINQDGKTNGITAPNEVSQTRLMQQVYERFDINPQDIQLIEAHGTGTKLGDPIEIAGLKAAFKPFTDNQDYCALGSAKSNIGHCLTAAGVAGVIKLVQSLRHKQLPPTINFEQQNEHINLDGTPFFINTRLQPWQVEPGQLRQGAVSSFGFSGTNAHLVVSEYVAPQAISPTVESRLQNGGVLLPISARTEQQLNEQIAQLHAFVEQNPSADLLSLAYTLQVGREVMDVRLGLIAESLDSLKDKLRAALEGQSSNQTYRATVKDHKAAMKLMAQDADMRTTVINRYLDQGKLNKLLELWTKGLEVDWQVLYPGAKPQRIVLPVYPFAKERYWIEAAQSEDADNRIHPLVHKNASLLSQQRYQSTFDVTDSVLSQGELPVSAIIEMVTAAVIDATQDVTQGAGITLHDIEFAAPLAIDGETQVNIDLDALQDGAVSFNMFAGETLYAQGVAELSAQAPSQWDINAMASELVVVNKDQSLSKYWPVGSLEEAIGDNAVVSHINSITINSTGNGSLQAHVRQDQSVDVDLIDASGMGCVRIEGMSISQKVDDSAAFTMMAAKWEVIEQFNATPWHGGKQILLIGGSDTQQATLGNIYSDYQIHQIELARDDSEAAIEAKLKDIAFEQIIWIADDKPLQSMRHQSLIDDQQVGIMQVFRLVKALVALGLDKQAIDWTLLTFNSVQVRQDDTVNPTHAALQGFSGVLAKEFRHWQVRLLDLQQVTEAVLEQADLLNMTGEGVCYAHREGQWFEQKLVEVKQLDLRNPPYRQDGVYVVIGGSGGIGEVWTEKVMRDHNAKVIWIGRRAQDDAITDKLARLAQFGTRPAYVQADVSDLEQMQNAYQAIKAEHKEIHGIIHSAVGAFDQSLKAVREQDFANILAVKIQGAVHLGQVFGDEPLDFVLGFSSNAAFARQGGMSGYSAGCTFKDTYLQQLGKSLGCVGKVMNWGYWSIGAGDTVSDSFKARFFESGHRPIEISEGMGALDRLLGSSIGQMSVAKMQPSVKAEMATPDCFVAQYEPTMSAYPDFSKIEQQPLPENFDSLDGKVGAEMEGLLPGLLNAILTETKDTLAFYQRWRMESHAIAERAGLKPDANVESAAQMWAKWDEAKVQWMKDESKKALCQLVETCLRALPDILTGKVKATDVVFPNSSLALVEAVYKTDTVSLAFNECLSDTVISAVKARLAAEPDAKIRILEIGAGTGSSTVGIIRKLKPLQDSIAEYCYTDLSKAFLFHAEKVYAPDAPYLVTKIFNVEEPIDGQGIDANKYDFVVAANVLHATKNIRNTMRNSKAVMKVGGAILLNEISDKSIYGHLTFGLLEGWWLNEDDELRIPGSPGLYPELWKAILNEEGFDPVYYPAKSVHQMGQQIVMAVSDGFVHQKQDPAVVVKAAPVVKAPVVSAQVKQAAKPIETAPVSQSIKTVQPAQTIQTASVDLNAKAIDLVKQVIGSVLKMSANQLDANEPLETYGIDSIIIGQVNEKLKTDFDDIDATVLYEHQTIAALAGYLVKSYKPRLTEKFGSDEQPETPVQAQVAQPVVVQSQVSTSNLPEKTRDYLKQVVGAALKMNQNQLDAQEPLETYGIDSIIIGQVNEQLKAKFDDIDATVLYECHTISAMAEYLMARFKPVLVEMFGETVTEVVASQPETPAVTTTAKPVKPIVRGRGMLMQGVPAAQSSGPIAIIGVSGIYPQAANLEQYWDNLKNGKDCVTEVPANRWDVDAFYDPDEQRAIDQGKSYSKWGGFVSQFAEFDAFFFGISPREAMDMDPQERLFLQEAWHALEDAGITRQTLAEQYKGEVGVFAGITRPGYNLYGSSEAIRKERFRPRSSFSSVANRLSYLLDIHGPSLPIDTMCSSSLTAIHEACSHIHRGDCDLAIAGGVNLYVHPLSYVDMASQHMFSKDGRCKSFGEGGNGFVPGEGAGVVILKPQAQAEQDKDFIHGLILATHINHGGKTNGYSVPNPKAQGDLIRRTIDKAGISARSISYIEAHGTGTELGDPIEISGLQQAFSPDSKDTGYCRIGSAKSNIGHCEGAAGIASFTKVLLQLQNKQIVPSLHADVLNPHIQFHKTAFIVNRELADWQAPEVEGVTHPRIAGVSSFGAGGGNAHVLMQEYDMPQTASAAGLSEPVAIVLSAKTADQLQQKVSDLVDFIANNGDDIDLTQMAYTLQLGREAMDERLAVLADSVDALAEKLSQHLYGEEVISELYTGRVQRNDAQLTLMREDEDFRSAINNWLLRRKLGKLLDLWVKGLNVDWALLYGDNKPGIMRLPTYPFAKDIYWIDSLNLDESASTESATLAAGMDAIADIFNQVEDDAIDESDAVKLIKSLQGE